MKDLLIFNDSNNNKSWERVLFRRVLSKAYLDALIVVNNRTPYNSILIKKEAIEWFNLENESFIEVCRRAEVEYSWAYKRFLELRDNPSLLKRVGMGIKKNRA